MAVRTDDRQVLDQPIKTPRVRPRRRIRREQPIFVEIQWPGHGYASLGQKARSARNADRQEVAVDGGSINPPCLGKRIKITA
jgi:hypothetical protein